MGLVKRNPPPPLLIPAFFAGLTWFAWHFDGPSPIAYVLLGVASVLAICDVLIFIGTGGSGDG